MLTNAEIADQLRTYADLMDLAGENTFRVAAFRKAADTVRDYPGALSTAGDLTALPGIGKGIAGVLNEIVTTGHFADLEVMQEAIPGSLLNLLDIPGIGAKTAAKMYQELGIASLEDLDTALRTGRLGQMKGMGAKAQERIATGLQFVQQRSGRTSIGLGWHLAQRIAADIEASLGARAEVAGSVRRMVESIGNIDIAVCADDVDGALAGVRSLPQVAAETDRGADWATYALQQGLSLRVLVAPEAQFGSAWLRMTGSATHMAKLGEIPDAASEKECYGALGLPWIAPELREDRGEIEAARAGTLPRLIELSDLRGDLHLHSTWSDGASTPTEMADAAKARGYQFLAITDHSGGLGIARGLNDARLIEQMAHIRGLGPGLSDFLLCGSEVEVHRDGRLDFSDDILGQLDIVVASLHSGLRQSRDEFSSRMCNTIANPNVDIIAHPSGRLVDRRQGADVDWERVFQAAKSNATILEINGDPARLDMRDEVARQAAAAGCYISIDSDAHHTDGLDNVRFGIGVARRAWISPEQVVTTWSSDQVRAWLKDRRPPD